MELKYLIGLSNVQCSQPYDMQSSSQISTTNTLTVFKWQVPFQSPNKTISKHEICDSKNSTNCTLAAQSSPQ